MLVAKDSATYKLFRQILLFCYFATDKFMCDFKQSFS